ncbi:hypothetical protein KIN20_037176 [Parelaphostrongylus tenuis]|uniref:Uncharacterized protein n=1 Tax=Parelaphostrongylus tenuis TaxID=148309 RepID=A0AAD5WLT6_PARTN|nr:hypothetical protein KIN20_037176 [Parelaphostrongylus tenuis]
MERDVKRGEDDESGDVKGILEEFYAFLGHLRIILPVDEQALLPLEMWAERQFQEGGETPQRASSAQSLQWRDKENLVLQQNASLPRALRKREFFSSLDSEQSSPHSLAGGRSGRYGSNTAVPPSCPLFPGPTAVYNSPSLSSSTGFPFNCFTWGMLMFQKISWLMRFYANTIPSISDVI